MPEKRDAFENQVDYKNKIKPVPKPSRITDLDTTHKLYDNIIDASETETLDMERLNSFTNISRSRNEVYNLLDMMGVDPLISAALDVYTSDVCEPSDNGHVMWCEAPDAKIAAEVNHLLDSINVDKYLYGWAFSLIKYGDLYLRLYRNSDYNDEPTEKEKEDARKLTEAYNVLDYDNLTEDLIVKAFKRTDHYAEYLEAVRNPAEMFNIYRMGKSYGYIRTHLPNEVRRNVDDYMTPFEVTALNNTYQFNRDDVEVYEATEYVHACLNESSRRDEEEVTLTTEVDEDGKSTSKVYTVKRGQSILYNAFKVWRELTLLEDSVLLNRVTKSSIIRTVSVEVGDMEKSDVQVLLNRVKQSIEQKSAINRGTSFQNYTNPGPVENTIYIPTHEGMGAITTGEIGGNVEVGDLGDLKYWKKKLFAALGIPGQYLGDTEDNTGFNGGTSLSLISSRYAKSVKRIQNALIQAITDAINMMLLDKGLTDYINRFAIKMQAPTTQEEKDRKDSETASISNVSTVMGLLEQIEDPATKLEILKSLLSSAITDTVVIDKIQEEIDRLEQESAEAEAAAEEGGDEEDEGDFNDLGGITPSSGGGSSGGFDLGGEEASGEEETSSEPLDLGGEEGGETGGEELPTPEETGAPEEGFLSSRGGEILNETDDLPSFAELGISYTDVR